LQDFPKNQISGGLYLSVLPGCDTGNVYPRIGWAYSAGLTAHTYPTQTPAQVATPLPGVPVNFGGQTIFYLYERMGSLSPAERAASISKKIAQLADDPFAPALEITLAVSDQGTDLMVGETVLLTVTGADAKAIGMQRDQAAQAAAKKIQETVQNYRQLNTPLSLAQRILITLGTLAILLMILFSLYGLLRRKLESVERAPASVDEDDFLAKAGLYRTGFWRRFIHLLFNLGMAAAVLISYQLNCYTKCPELMSRIYTALHQNILDAFNQAGVEIMSPAFTALRDGNTITLPVENRPADYQAPGIRVDYSQSVVPVEYPK